MKEASEAIKKAIETIESAAPEAWRLTVEGYRAQALSDLLTHLLLSVTFLVGILLLIRLSRVPLAVMKYESSRDLLAKNSGREFKAEGTVALIYVAVAFGFILGLVQLSSVPGDIARAVWAEPLAAKRLVEAALN